MPKRAEFRFYEELNDFLPEDKKKSLFSYEFMGKPTIKDAVESLGVPHTEIDLILVNRKSVTFTYHLQDMDTVSVYPVFESMDISQITHLRVRPLRVPKFIADVHLGKLAKYLRMLGLDTVFENNYAGSDIVTLSKKERRAILTRNASLLKNKSVTHGYWIRTQEPEEQITEVILRFDLHANIKPLCRCIVCNGLIQKTTKESVINKLPPKTRLYFDEFYQCASCAKIYWKGSHYDKMMRFIEQLVSR